MTGTTTSALVLCTSQAQFGTVMLGSCTAQKAVQWSLLTSTVWPLYASDLLTVATL